MYIMILDLCVCSLCREGKRQEKTQKLSMQQVAAMSPPLKREEQGEKKQRKTQELLRRIHTSKQRVSITFLYLRL